MKRAGSAGALVARTLLRGRSLPLRRATGPHRRVRPSGDYSEFACRDERSRQARFPTAPGALTMCVPGRAWPRPQPGLRLLRNRLIHRSRRRSQASAESHAGHFPPRRIAIGKLRSVRTLRDAGVVGTVRVGTLRGHRRRSRVRTAPLTEPPRQGESRNEHRADEGRR